MVCVRLVEPGEYAGGPSFMLSAFSLSGGGSSHIPPPEMSSCSPITLSSSLFSRTASIDMRGVGPLEILALSSLAR